MNQHAAESERRLANVIRIGRIVELDAAQARVKVEAGGNTTDWLPWAVQRAGGDRTWHAPEVGEQVVIASPGGDLGDGVIIGALYQDDHPAAGDTANKTRTVFSDGAVVEYDRAEHKYSMTVPAGGAIRLQVGGSYLEITSDGITASAPRIDWNS